ncbi:hypothetical protein OPV22_012575 [Ensete ventricosum]|uniref:DDT domain-containing protein n=1 Tax=Ensete ventricosum TaxID=4639 RepID=A0AAV8PH83_ENSVE|nr:hypothetical protein OPV22_012575 [Ensete ventricosum]
MAVARNTTAADRRAAEGSKTTAEASSSSATSPRKRTKSPGVRVIGGRIYDSENGKTCHQCRQKTMDFAASCKHLRGDKPCTIKFCHKCLLNRYGENAEEAALLENWSCPKCRGVCNCSFCMKKKGQQPTGILIHAAKATGFSSVHELLDNKGSDVLSAANGLRSLSAGIPPTCTKGSVAPKRSRDKEKDHDEQKDVQCSVTVDDEKDEVPAKKQKKRRLKKLRSLNERDGGNVIELCNGNAKLKNANARKKGAKKVSAISNKIGMQLNNDEHVPNNCGDNEGQDLQHVARLFKQLHDDMNSCINKDEIKVSDKGKKNNVHDKTLCKGQRFQKHGIRNSNSDEAEVLVDMRNKNVKAKLLPKKHKSRKPGAKDPFEHDNLSIVVPQGLPLIEVAGCDWAAEDVGAALQFLEFCNAFSEVLDIKKGEPECVLRELARGRVGRRGVYSSILQFHIKLLSFIQKDLGDGSISYSTSGENWLQTLVECLNESECALEIPSKCLNKGPLTHNSLDLSEKLRLLNLLCDRTLGTEEVRNWIDEENKRYIERNKEVKETIVAAKRKGKDLKKKLKDDVAKAMLILRGGPPLSVAEHENLVSQIRAETEKAHAEMLEIMELLPKNSDNMRCNAVRTQPVFLEGKGCVYWKLAGCCNNPKIILQDIGSWDSVILEDKWFAYDEKEEKAVDRHISSFWNLGRRIHGRFLKQESHFGHGVSCDSVQELTSSNCSA